MTKPSHQYLDYLKYDVSLEKIKSNKLAQTWPDLLNQGIMDPVAK
jgi:hypothetical protein